jgi:hypothetical protein
MRKSLYLLLVLSTCLSAKNTAYVSWASSDEATVYRLDLVTGNLDVFSDRIEENAAVFTLNYGSEEVFSSENGTHFTTDDGFIASFGGTGQVFKVSFKDSSVSRLDGTYQHGYNFDAFKFMRDDVLMSFGGYGFWMENNLLTKFDEDAKEWFLVSNAPFPVEIENNSSVRHLRWYDEQQDKLYVSHYRTLYQYDFKNDSWSASGRLHEDLLGTSYNHFNRINDSLGLVQNRKGQWLLDWRSNKLVRLDLTGREELSPNSGILGIHCMYSVGDSMLTIKRSDKLEAGFLRSFHQPSNWEVMGEQRLFTPYWWYKTAFYAIVLLLVTGIILLIVWRYRIFVRKRSSWMEFLTPQDKLLFNALKIGDLDTEEVNRILELEDVGWEVQRRKRSEAIKSINAFASKALGFDIIERYKSPKDKRQVIYRLNKALK